MRQWNELAKGQPRCIRGASRNSVFEKLLTVLLGVCVVAGCCTSDNGGRELSDSFTAALATLSRQFSGAQDVSYATAAFKRKNGRWPNDYAELTNFVNQSEGYLQLADYDQVRFTKMGEGDLTIECIGQGRTNLLGFSHREKQSR